MLDILVIHYEKTGKEKQPSLHACLTDKLMMNQITFGFERLYVYLSY